MTRVSLAREAGCNPVVSGSTPERVSIGPWSNGKGDGPLNRKCGSDSRRAD